MSTGFRSSSDEVLALTEPEDFKASSNDGA